MSTHTSSIHTHTNTHAGSELDRAYHKHYRRLVALSDAKEKELLAEAAKTQGEKQHWGVTLLNVTTTLTYGSLARVSGRRRQ